MNDLTQEEYDEWHTCPGCGQQHAPSKDCEGGELVRPPQRGGHRPSPAPPPNNTHNTDDDDDYPF